MTSKNLYYLIIGLLIVLSLIFFFMREGQFTSDRTFLTIATFLFSIFAGFFISRQSTRYSKIRETIANFDGKMSTIYRVSGHIGKELQVKIGEVVKAHYKMILDNTWDYHFTNKSTTITSIHGLVQEAVGDQKLEALKNQTTGTILRSLGAAQDLRKLMVSLYQERIDSFQWLLIYFFATILALTVSFIPSYYLWLPAILKATFLVSILSTIIILKNLDNLHLFEGAIGTHSAEDVVGIIEGIK
jgi:hypothetical protein